MAMKFTGANAKDIDSIRNVTGEEALQTVFGWLAGPSERRQMLADAMLVTLGQSVLPELTAMSTRCPPELQLRIIRIIVEIGGTPSAELIVAMTGLSMFGDARIGAEVAAMSAKLSLPRIKLPARRAAWARHPPTHSQAARSKPVLACGDNSNKVPWSGRPEHDAQGRWAYGEGWGN